jgi:hypothetical protein
VRTEEDAVTAQTEHAIDADELDAACQRMLPAAARFVAAVRARDEPATRAAFADAQRVQVPLGRSTLAVLAVVLADMVTAKAATAAGGATIRERTRCVHLAVAVITDSPTRMLENARRLPERISRGEKP